MAEPKAKLSRRGLRWALEAIVLQHLTVARAAEGGPVLEALVLGRVIEPTSKLDTVRVLEEVGVAAPSYPTMGLDPSEWTR